MRHVIHTNQSCHTHISCHMCGMTYVWHDSSICVAWLIHMCGMTHPYVWHDSSICVAWLIHMCGITHPYVWHDSSICVAWLIHMCGMTHPYVWHDSSICVPWLIDIESIQSTHGGDHIENISISRLDSFPVHSFEWRGLPFTPVKTCLKIWGLPSNLVWKLRGLPWKPVEI